MESFIYQYSVMWVVFVFGCVVGARTGELGFSGVGGRRLLMLVVGMLGYMALQATFTDWSGL